MSVLLSELVGQLNTLLDVASIQDYCPNGLQIEGAPVVHKIVGGVTASQALIDEAISRNADAILVHHGYFWKGENPVIQGIKRKRIASLLAHDISLLAYHLPLDVHPELGNNARLARLLGLQVCGPLDLQSRNSVGIVVELPESLSAESFSLHISDVLGREVQHFGDSKKKIKRLGLCTGAAQGMIDKAVDLQLDGYLSGEVSEPTFHIAMETGVNYFAAGHHATEREGVKALGEYLSEKYKLAFEFIDITNPV